MSLLEEAIEILKEKSVKSVKSVKGGIDIGDGIRVMKVGRDQNGNSGYSVKTNNGKRARFIQKYSENTIVDINDFRHPDANAKKAIAHIKHILSL